MKLETLLIRAGADVDPATGSIAPPVHLSTTFEHGPAGESPLGYSYIRDSISDALSKTLTVVAK